MKLIRDYSFSSNKGGDKTTTLSVTYYNDASRDFGRRIANDISQLVAEQYLKDNYKEIAASIDPAEIRKAVIDEVARMMLEKVLER